MFDLVIVGGGINGCGIARDAAGRGLSVGLIEMNDLASGTSSASTKLIHGGLRYLEHWQFALVREALIEREVLLRIAPHLVQSMRFVLPVLPGMRPAWMLRAGLFLYDHLDRHRTLPGTAALDLRSDAAGQPLRPGLARGFEYSDCTVDDARLVVLNARDAADRGAVVRTRTKMLSAIRQEDNGQTGLWRIEVMGPDGTRSEMRARALINAAGPWAGDVANRTGGKARTRLRLDQGSHIVVRRLFAGGRSYIFQNGDGRIVFAIPYHRDFTLIGTTDHDFSGDPATVAASEAEIDYLIAAANLYFAQTIGRTDVVWSYAGVRALVEGEGSAASATREYRLEAAGDPPLIHVFGGKITAYRPLAEKALALLSPHFPAINARGAWTGEEPLPGGDFGEGGIAALEAELTQLHPWLDRTLLSRWLHAYGTDTITLLGGASGYGDLGQSFGAGLFEREVDWLIHREWAMTAEDILWRRSKLGLSMSAEERDGLNKHLAQRL